MLSHARKINLLTESEKICKSILWPAEGTGKMGVNYQKGWEIIIVSNSVLGLLILY